MNVVLQGLVNLHPFNCINSKFLVTRNVRSKFVMCLPFDTLSNKHDVILVPGSNRKVLTQMRQHLLLKHLVTTHEQVVNMQANESMRSASLSIIPGYRIHQVINRFCNRQLFGCDTLRWLICFCLGCVTIQSVPRHSF